jgi:hypothetical protein
MGIHAVAYSLASPLSLGTSVRGEVTRWFFDDYLVTWVGVGSGAIARGPEFILDYYDVPLHHCTPDGGEWLLDGGRPAGAHLQSIASTRLRAHRGAGPPGDRVSRRRGGD